MFLDILVDPLHKNGEETTPSGGLRWIFWFGRHKQDGQFYLFKFNNYKTINEPPYCVLTCPTITAFVQTAKDVGLHISAADKRRLTQTGGPHDRE